MSNLPVTPPCVQACLGTHWFTDYQNVVHVLQVGSRTPDLYAIRLKVFNITIQYPVPPEPNWLISELNQRANLFSQIVDFGDWYLNPAVLLGAWTLCGGHTHLMDLLIIHVITTHCQASSTMVNVGLRQQRMSTLRI